MKIKPFGVEIWMNEWELKCELNLAETCVESITIGELLDITGKNETDLAALLPMKMTYGAIEGSERLRKAISVFYQNLSLENIVVTHGTISANMLIHRTLVERGDKVISVIPTYQQHYSIPESIGANVEHLLLREKNAFLPDLNELRSMATKDTKLIAINNPNNPTGSLMNRQMLEEIVKIAKSCDAYILCDEVYRGVDQEGSGMTTSIADLYDKGISTAGMSKAYSLAGLRLGWIAASRSVIEAVLIQRDYDTISVGMISDHFATIALENHDKILKRNQNITRTNLSILENWVNREPRVSWIKPKSGTTALLKIDVPMTSREFCIALLNETGVMFTPGSAMEMEGYIRIGYANNQAILTEGLSRVSKFLAKQK